MPEPDSQLVCISRPRPKMAIDNRRHTKNMEFGKPINPTFKLNIQQSNNNEKFTYFEFTVKADLQLLYICIQNIKS
ncbi:hypothetical protein RchiOBHm_Chr2g0171211 [Rosa chinensis]|uniref:Uncharacterized protein n=1 Tax=Rosa chinensis TaxID=74649 RepID=A0A2P6S5B9_ROSCH|nr:hypothetical protein RchiOBHm_Chr2g0171211 [Rosa chinensis]